MVSLSPNAWQVNIKVAGVAKQLPEVDSGQSKCKHLEEHHAAKASSMYCGMPPFLDSRTAVCPGGASSLSLISRGLQEPFTVSWMEME